AGRAWWIFALLLAPHLVAPVLTAWGTTSPGYRLGFTRLMQFGLFPVIGTVLFFSLRALVCGPRLPAWRDFRLTAFGASTLLTLAGIALGACIRDSTTMIPAHYHASIGAVTVAFMGVTYQWSDHFGL